MKLAMVSEHASPLAVLGGVDAGGQNVHVADLARALGRLGVDVVVHTRRDGPGLPRRVEFAPNVVVDHVPAGPAAPIPKDHLLPHMPAFAADLYATWRRSTPDLVHSHFWMSGLVALHAARPLDVPVAHTFHALGLVKRRNQGAHDTSPSDRIRAERMLARSVDRVIATTADEASELTADGTPPGNVVVVPCGVDLSHFRPDGPAEVRGSRRRVVVVSRLVERKGIGNVVEALAGRDDVELVVAGGPSRDRLDDDPEGRRLRRLAATTGLGDRLILLGAIGRAGIPALLRSADVVACCPWYEPFGLVAVEAMACGVPVVATRVGGLAESVVDGVTGVLVPPRSPAAVARALDGLLADTGLRFTMGAAGAVRARRFGWDRIAAETLAVARALVDGARPHPVRVSVDGARTA